MTFFNETTNYNRKSGNVENRNLSYVKRIVNIESLILVFLHN